MGKGFCWHNQYLTNGQSQKQDPQRVFVYNDSVSKGK